MLFFSHEPDTKLNTREGHHQYLNHYGQPEARLMRTHSLGERPRNLENSPVVTGVAVAMFYLPIMVLKRLREIYVDGLVSGVDIKAFTDDFSTQSKAQTTVVSATSCAQMRTLTTQALSGKRHHGSRC
jgi:hypothetical protein